MSEPKPQRNVNIYLEPPVHELLRREAFESRRKYEVIIAEALEKCFAGKYATVRRAKRVKAVAS